MSNLPAIINTDMTTTEIEKVNEFIKLGTPGLADITDKQIYKMYELYLSGSTYSQISEMLNIKKVVLHYLSHTSGWYESKKEYLNEVQENIKNRVHESKLNNKEFALLVMQAYRKRITTKLRMYLATDEEQYIDGIDLKELSQMMKNIEVINGLDETGKNEKGKAPILSLNLGDGGANIEKTGENMISITPTQSVSSALKQLADARRAEEKNNELNSHDKNDIVGEKGDKND